MKGKKTLKQMAHHRKQYAPMMEKLVKIFNITEKNDLPREIQNSDDIFLIIELIDIGYLNKEAFTIKKRFGEISNIFFDGEYPLTDKGNFLLNHEDDQKRKKNVITLIIVFLILIFLIILAILH